MIYMGKTISHLMKETANDQNDERSAYIKILPALGSICIHVYYHYFQTSPKPGRQLNQKMHVDEWNKSRVAMVREKSLENEFFSRSGKSQGISVLAREILKKDKSQGI